MKITKTGLIVIGLLGILLLLSSASIVNSLWSIMSTSPWWTYLLVVGVIISGYMAFKHTKEDYESDQEFIEQEGNIYMQRLEAERERRRNSQSS